MKIYYHAPDLDGRCSGAILARRYPDAEIIGYNYWYDFYKSFSSVEPKEPIIFADVTPRIDTLKSLMEITKDITIIDHHSGSINELKAAGLEFPGIMVADGGVGACVLTWQWCYSDYPDKLLPKGVQWLGEYDAWQRTRDNKLFHYGMLAVNSFPNSKIWDKVLTDDPLILEELLKTGEHVLAYLVPWYKRLLGSYACKGKSGDHSAILLNQGGVDSSVFDSLNEKYDLYFRVVFAKDQMWHVSVTTERDDIDVAELAAKYGGGGHAKSAGFIISDLDEIFTKE